jgi:hypothetical protein
VRPRLSLLVRPKLNLLVSPKLSLLVRPKLFFIDSMGQIDRVRIPRSFSRSITHILTDMRRLVLF